MTTDFLLTDSEPPPFTVINESGTAPCLIIGDHTGDYVPESLNILGLKTPDLHHHAAIDIGTRHLIEKLSELLNAPAIMANYSRLVVDLNRRLDHPTAFPDNLEGRPIPGNMGINPQERTRRTTEIYDPYHNEIARLCGAFKDRDIVPVILSIHSFVPVFYKQVRPWEVGILWTHDDRVPLALIRYFAQKGYYVGNNEPYDARMLRGTTIDRHADQHNLPNALIEYRHNEIDTPEKADQWAQMTAEAMTGILADKTINSLYDGPRLDYDIYDDVAYFDELIKHAQQGE